VISFLGIDFRSAQHLYWFEGTSLVLLAGLAATAWAVWSRAPADSRRVLAIFLTLVGGFHVAVSIEAARRAWHAIHVTHTSPNGPLFSVDCIWFNALMAGFYVVSLLTVLRARTRPVEV
jgi:hypothetical protein